MFPKVYQLQGRWYKVENNGRCKEMPFPCSLSFAEGELHSTLPLSFLAPSERESENEEGEV